MAKKKSKSIEQILTKPNKTGVDLRSLGGLHSCLCGSELWHIVCKFNEGEICFYYLDMVCVSCGAFAKAPIPTDDLD